MAKKKKTGLVIAGILSVALIGSGIAVNKMDEKPKDEPDVPSIEQPLPEEPGNETPDVPEEPGNETPDVPEEPEVVEPLVISVDNISYTTAGGGTDYSYKLAKVTMNDVENKTDIADGDMLSITWNSGAIVTLNVDLNDIDTSKYTHLTFVFGSEKLNFSSGYAKFVQDYAKTVFKSGKYFVSTDGSIENSVSNRPSTTAEDYLKLGDWKRFEIPIEDVIECYNTNGKINLFHFMSSNLTTSTLYLSNIQFENLA